MANYPQALAQDAVCQSHIGHMTGLWFLPARLLRLNTNEWVRLNMFRILVFPSSGTCKYAVELPHWSFLSWFAVCWRLGAVGLLPAARKLLRPNRTFARGPCVCTALYMYKCLSSLCSTHTHSTLSASLDSAVHTCTTGKYAAITPTTSMSTDTIEPLL